jgi:hypothetical protein
MAPCCCSGSGGGGGCGQCHDNRHKALHQIKLERLQAIRLQEKNLAREKSQQYLQLKEQKKRIREDEVKKKKYQQQVQEYQEKCSQFAEMMVSNGTSHRSADENFVQTTLKQKEDIRKQKLLNSHQQKRGILALEQRGVEIQKKQFPFQQAKEKRDFIIEQAHLDREAASLSHDNYIAKEKYKIQQAAAAAAASSQHGHPTETIQKYSLQSSESIESRGRVIVQAKIIKHDTTTLAGVKNNIMEQREQQRARVHQKVHQELTSQVQVKKRYQKAQQLVTEEKELRILSSEFEILEKIDRSGNRIHRLNNRDKVIRHGQQEDFTLLHSSLPHNRTKFQTTTTSLSSSPRSSPPRHIKGRGPHQVEISSQEKERCYDEVFEKNFLIPFRQEQQQEQPHQEQGQERSRIGSGVARSERESQTVADSSRQLLQEQYQWQDPSVPLSRDKNVNGSPYQSPPSVTQTFSPSSHHRPAELIWTPVTQEFGHHTDMPLESSSEEFTREEGRSTRRTTQRKKKVPPVPTPPPQGEREDYISTLYHEALQTARDVFESTFLHHHRADLFEDQSTSLIESDDAFRHLGDSREEAYGSESDPQTLSEEVEEDPIIEEPLPSHDTNDFSTKYYLLSYKDSTHATRAIPPRALMSEENSERSGDGDDTSLHEDEGLAHDSTNINGTESIQMSETDDHGVTAGGKYLGQETSQQDISDDSMRFTLSTFLSLLL